MLKEMNYQKKFELLEPWFAHIIESVKKDIRQEHLAKDRQFTKNFFGNKPVIRITNEELVDVYNRLIKEGQEQIAEFVAVRWLLKHTELYNYFEHKLSKISPDFDKLEVLNDQDSQEILKGAIDEFGSVKSYLFTVFNSVVFPESHLSALRSKAAEELSNFETAKVKAEEAASIEELKKAFGIEMQRVHDRYEKKISGLQKKYIQDTENLKKQISGLQRKLTR
jgi:hypothetical protein